MANYNGKICPICEMDIRDYDSVKICSSCGILYHKNCWIKNHGCLILGCPNRYNKSEATFSPRL